MKAMQALMWISGDFVQCMARYTIGSTTSTMDPSVEMSWWSISWKFWQGTNLLESNLSNCQWWWKEQVGRILLTLQQNLGFWPLYWLQIMLYQLTSITLLWRPSWREQRSTMCKNHFPMTSFCTSTVLNSLWSLPLSSMKPSWWRAIF